MGRATRSCVVPLVEPHTDRRGHEAAALEDVLRANIPGLCHYRDPPKALSVGPRDGTEHYCLSEPSTARRFVDGDQADVARVIARKASDVADGTPIEVGDEHGIRESLEAARDPGVVEVVATLAFKARICIEA